MATKIPFTCPLCSHHHKSRELVCRGCGKDTQLERWEVKRASGDLWLSQKKKELKEALLNGTVKLNEEARQVPIVLTGKDKNGKLTYDVAEEEKETAWHPLRDVLADEWDLKLLFDPIDAMGLFVGALFFVVGLFGFGSMRLAPYLQDLGAGAVASYIWAAVLLTSLFTLIGFIISSGIFFLIYKYPSGLTFVFKVLFATLWGLLVGFLLAVAGVLLGALLGSLIKPKIPNPGQPQTLAAKFKEMWDQTA